ncbi:MAG: cytochrome c3 family protein [Duodenibacillus sp.]|nr:cytochrome c3 family protein [Duodenibacillus sp.]
MQKRSLLLIGLTVFGFIQAAQAAPSATPLADRHVAKGITCAICHGTDKPEPFAEVPNTTCFQCHGSLDSLKAKFKHMGKQNPHDNHLGDVACNICHKGHEPSSVYCEKCHKNFKLNIR